MNRWIDPAELMTEEDWENAAAAAAVEEEWNLIANRVIFVDVETEEV